MNVPTKDGQNGSRGASLDGNAFKNKLFAKCNNIIQGIKMSYLNFKIPYQLTK